MDVYINFCEKEERMKVNETTSDTMDNFKRECATMKL